MATPRRERDVPSRGLAKWPPSKVNDTVFTVLENEHVEHLNSDKAPRFSNNNVRRASDGLKGIREWQAVLGFGSDGDFLLGHQLG